MKHKNAAIDSFIPVDLIHETVMPPYEYQKPQNGFGSIGTDDPVDDRKAGKDSVAKPDGS